MTPLHDQVRRTIARHALCGPGSRLLIALSGGSDSVALAFVLRDLAAYDGFSLAALAHLNHRLRPTAGRDEQFCRDLAARMGLPILVDALDVQGYAASQRLSLEEAARRLRYDFLHKAGGQAGADRIAVGHTRDDQAETVLLKLMRGAGSTGLAGVFPRRGAVIRPLLDVARSDLRSYLTMRGETWVDDETNDDIDNPRNRIRHQVLPQLDHALRGDVRPALARAASLAREDGQFLDELAERRYAEVAITTGDTVELDAGALAGEAMAVRRRVVWTALRAVSGNREVGLDHVEAALLVLGGEQAAMDGPGSRVELRRGKLVLFRQRVVPG